jgi:asparagine synthase (glutamine-hydrolysing)
VVTALAEEAALLSSTHTVSGSLDACSIGEGRVDSLAQLADLAQQGRLSEVEGAFHLAIENAPVSEQGSLLLARDAIGHRTVFYGRNPHGKLVQAPDIRTLLRRDEVAASLNPRSVASYLSCAYIPGRGTLFQGVKELLPGHVLHHERGSGKISETPFFALPDEDSEDSLTPKREQDAIAFLRTLLESAVQSTLDLESPQSAFLSGGIDSSLVVALVQNALRAGGSSHTLRTFSIAFGSEHKNELEWSSMVAKHCGTEHSIVHLSPEQVLANLDETHARLASPIGDPLTVPNAILFGMAKAHAPYVWNGEGGDPCFGGPKNLPMLLAELYGDGENAASANESQGSPRARSYYRAHLKCFDELETLMTKDALAALKHDPLEADVDPYFNDKRSFVGALSAINVTWKGGHHILPKVFDLANAVGIRPRSPLFAKSVVEYASRLPSSLKLRGSVEKYALKEAVRDLLPSAIIDRPKSGMMVPVEDWFQGPLLAHAKERLLFGALPFDLLQRPAIEALVAGKVRGLRPRRGVKIWLLVALESYLRQFK